jgi:hypothetical protein
MIVSESLFTKFLLGTGTAAALLAVVETAPIEVVAKAAQAAPDPWQAITLGAMGVLGVALQRYMPAEKKVDEQHAKTQAQLSLLLADVATAAKWREDTSRELGGIGSELKSHSRTLERHWEKIRKLEKPS